MSEPTKITWDSFQGVLPDDCDVINVKFEPNAVHEVSVELVLQSDMDAWKQMTFSIDTGGGNIGFEPRVVYTEGTKRSATMYMDPETIANSTAKILFSKVKSGLVQTDVYLLDRLADKIKPGMRVTFHWRKDSCAYNASGTNGKRSQATDIVVGDAVGSAGRLFYLLGGLEKLLSEKYAFDVFAANSVNFGILVTYRQKWQPVNYQVGDLVSTIPLAPKEVRRYTTKTVTKKTRARKEMEDSLKIRKLDSTDTFRVDAEITKDAFNKTSFDVTANESFGKKDLYNVNLTETSNQQQSNTSHQVKKTFHENVLKSAQEYRDEHKVEIDTSESEETESTVFHEIQNPNDELAVTYLFYELQRTYRISEKIHKLTPVILVANDVPSPHEIDDAWLLKHSWILNRVILDDSLRPALEYLSKSFAGAEINIRVLADSATMQKNLVDRLGLEIQGLGMVLSRSLQDVKNAVMASAQSQQQKDFFDTVKSVFDPLGLIKGDPAATDAAQTIVDYTKETLDRTEKEKEKLESQLEAAVSALQTAVDKLASAIKEHFDKLTEIDKLRIHVKDNILYYMQAIWDHEPPDQRFFRLYKQIDVPVITPKTLKDVADVYKAESAADALSGSSGVDISIPMPDVTFETKKLVDVADIDNLLGYKGNYMIFPLKDNNYLTLHMMQDYLNIGDVVTLRDPDELGSYTLDEIQELAACVYRKDKDTFLKFENDFKKLMIDRLTSSPPDDNLVIVPTNSLYIEALVGTHPLLEDFKLIHRALDVKKVQAEVRHAELENIRLASRDLKGKDEDPDIEKKVVVETNNQNITVEADGG
ncbi:MAG: hypothetical protein LAO31_19370 [Acidobacteriia bacterium]|nr:hypothetical protein [Terriglobia bacterium]